MQYKVLIHDAWDRILIEETYEHWVDVLDILWDLVGKEEEYNCLVRMVTDTDSVIGGAEIADHP